MSAYFHSYLCGRKAAEWLIDMMDEDKIVQRARRGDAAAFEQLVTAYRDRVYRLALRLCGNEADADEAAQDAFLAAWRGLPNFRGESKFSTWLYQLVNHAAIDLLRREKRQVAAGDIDEVDTPDTAPSPHHMAERNEQRQAVREAVLALPEEQRQVVVLRFMEELSYEEIGAALHLPTGTVKSRLNRAKAALREILSQKGNLFDGENVIHTEKNGKEVQP